MKKQLRIVLTFLLVAAFFITAEIIPEITNHLTDQKNDQYHYGFTWFHSDYTHQSQSVLQRASRYFFIRNDRCLGNFDNGKGRNFDRI